MLTIKLVILVFCLKILTHLREETKINLARQELDAAAIRLLFDSNKQNRTHFKVEEFKSVNVLSSTLLILSASSTEY